MSDLETMRLRAEEVMLAALDSGWVDAVLAHADEAQLEFFAETEDPSLVVEAVAQMLAATALRLQGWDDSTVDDLISALDRDTVACIAATCSAGGVDEVRLQQVLQQYYDRLAYDTRTQGASAWVGPGGSETAGSGDQANTVDASGEFVSPQVAEVAVQQEELEESARELIGQLTLPAVQELLRIMPDVATLPPEQLTGLIESAVLEIRR